MPVIVRVEAARHQSCYPGPTGRGTRPRRSRDFWRRRTTTRASERADAAARGLERLGLDFIAYVPSNTIAPIIEHFRRRNGGADAPRAFPVTREEEAVGIIAAVSLAGRSGAIIMQDNGFGNALTALATFAVAYHRPLLIVANTRGGLGEYNSMIHTISEAAPGMLREVGIPVHRLDRRNAPDDWEATIHEAGRHAQMTHRPVVVLMEFWDWAGLDGGKR